MRYLRFILTVLLGSASLALADQPDNDGPGPQPSSPPGLAISNKNHGNGQQPGARQQSSLNGTYTIFFKGDFTGTGTALISDSTVTITVTLFDKTGHAKPLSANYLTVAGPYFGGVVSGLGPSGQIVGRLDCAAASRIGGTLTTDGRLARFAGLLSTTQSNPHWQDD